MSAREPIETLDDARAYARGAACAGCGKEGTLTAHEVQKEGPNRGRLFAKCGHCGFFDWLTAAQTPDPVLEQLRAGAGDCPRCAKPRRAGRATKDGPNKGRLFLACADPACGGFEWRSARSEPEPDAPPAPSAAASLQPLDEAGFLAAIRDNPDEDTTRLVFADWLDDHEQPARAELIRAQIECARLPVGDPARAVLEERAGAILAEHEAEWVADVRPLATAWTFARGLLDEVTVNAETFAAHADQLLRAAGAAAIRVLVRDRGDVRAFVAHKRFRDLRRVAVAGERTGAACARILAESPAVVGLKALALSGQSIGEPGAAALAASRYLSALEVLDLTDNNLARSAVPFLASSANLPRLRRLVLAHNRLQDSDARALANSSHLRELRELDLSGNGFSREGIGAVCNSPLGARLKKFVH